MSAHPAVHPSVGPFVRWPARLRRRSSSPPLRSDTPASHRCGRMHRPSHRIPSAVSAAPRRIDAPFTPAPRPPHCVSSAASAALPPGRRVRRAPSAPGESGTHAPSCGIRRIRGYVRSLRPARLVSGSPALQPPQPHAPPMSSPPCPRPTAAAARPESKISIKAYSGTAKNSYFWWQKNARSALRCVRTERFRQAGRRSAFARAIPEGGNDREKQQRKT